MLDLNALTDLLIRGAPLQTALVQLGRSPSEIVEDAARPEMQALLAAVRRVLTNNLTSALYRRAMEGSIPALTFWLSHYPESPFHQATGRKPDENPYDRMTDDELLAHAQQLGLTLEDLNNPHMPAQKPPTPWQDAEWHDPPEYPEE